jgi:type VI secretion system VgrG family protein
MTSLDKNLNAGNRRFSFASKAYAADKFSVVKMEGFEAISASFSFELTLVSDDVSVDFEKMLSNPATFTFYAAGGNMETPYHGVLSEFEQLHQAGALVFYRAVLAPRLQRLNLYRTSDVHLNDKTIPDILEAVIKDSGFTSADFEQKLKAKDVYRKRSFVCQYQETNLDFIARWLEKEGMYFYFDHSGNAEKLVMVDDTAVQPADVLAVTYRPVENMASGAARDSVQEFLCRQKPLPKQVILQGFNYSSANVELKQTAQVSAAGTGDVMLYGENFLTQDEGQRYAKLRAQEILCGGKVFKGEATAVGLRSGYFMRMAAHYRSDFNGQYLVTEVEHKGSQAGVLLAGIENSYGGKPGETDYHLTFRAIPSAVQFRPARAMIRPHVAGTISAIVDAEGSGEYAEMDELGQYKVQLPFSRTGKAANKGSARIRMATPYSGSNHGIHFPLHKGAEVLLSFVDGDPDQPVIVNAVPNSENPSVVNNKNPSKDVIKSAGGNFLELEDKKGSERAHLYSPSARSNWRVGAATSAAAGVTTWGENKTGIHGSTEETVSFNAGKTMVLRVDPTTLNLAGDPVQGSLNLHAKSHLLDIDGTKPVANAAPATGSYHVYAKHIRMFAEPNGSSFKYKLETDSTPTPEDSWDLGKLYELQSFTDNDTLTRTDGTVESNAANKTTYVKGNSNSATFGDASSVVHGNKTTLFRGKELTHTYGMSTSMYFGMKSDLMTGFTNSAYVGGKHEFYAGEKISTAVSAELKVALSATADVVFGTKNTFHAAAEINASVLLKAENKVLEVTNRLTSLDKSLLSLTQGVFYLGEQVTKLEMASLHMDL